MWRFLILASYVIHGILTKRKLLIGRSLEVKLTIIVFDLNYQR